MRRCYLCVFAFCCTLLLAAPGAAQWPPIVNSAAPTETTLSWRPNAERSCGRLVCSDIYLYGSPGVSFTVAGPAAAPEVAGLSVETRAQLVQRSFREVLRVQQQQPRVQAALLDVETTWMDLLQPRAELHPSTPRVEVGIENDQTVVFLPDQAGLQQQTLVTVNEFDALHNGQQKESLAMDWRTNIRDGFSHTLWERSFDRQYPWARPLVAIAIVSLAVILTGLIEGGRRRLRRRSRTLSRRLKASEKELKKSMAIEPEAITPDALQEPSAQLDIPLWSASVFSPLAVVTEAGQSVNQLLSILSKGFLKEQTLLKQQRNLLRFGVLLVFWVEMFVVFGAGSVVSQIYPITRPYTPYIFSQAILLPVIWLGITLIDSLVDIEIDYHLNQWGKDAQLDDAQSNRVALRVSTYSPAIKSATTVFFTLLGLYLTIQAFGIDPAVLASAGAIAVIAAYISRSVLQDMLNGAVILWTDRFAVGDVIQVGEYAGLVEDMSLYTTQLRGPEGRLITIPNGQISTVENLTKEWSRVDFTIEIAYDADIKQALEIIRVVADALRTEPLWQDKILEPASILGVDHISHTGILLQVWIKTQAMHQWAVGREFRLRIKQAFDEANIQIGLPQQTILLRR
ncbi:MAG: mechanosensitive ion channel family protein [Cyanobacteria bacterium P01_H01_bin.26]